MIVVAVIATAFLGIAALAALVRLEKGPSMLDRTVAFDVLTTTIVGAVAVEAAWSRRTESIPILVVLSLVGFVGSVTIARFAAREPEDVRRIRTAAEVAAEEAAREARREAEREAARRRNRAANAADEQPAEGEPR